MIPIRPLVISAPFGNYIQPKKATATLGTFTADARPPGTKDNPAKGGRLIQIIKTVRYNPLTRQWRNKIGLRNPGIQSLVDDYDDNPPCTYQKIVSIHGFNRDEWKHLLLAVRITHPLAIEINASCPNVEDDEDPNVALTLLGDETDDIIIKLPPQDYLPIVEKAWEAGVRCFHCCNTIPSSKGGLSGKPLMDLSLRAVSSLRRIYGAHAQIIGGGGVTSMRDVNRYFDAGADHVSVASCLFFPWNILKFKWIAKRLSKDIYDIGEG